ncbi:MAG: hypothetical protein IJO46_04670 [Thermoguttaceae bacterium]|nr:hypothetical protein [Thermoguttaceae bacterium]
MATEMNFGIICDLFIASSSDCEKAKPIIAQACYEWNQVHGHKEKVFILPRFCEVDGYPALCRPQDQLNKVLDQCDIAVALVWYKFANGLREELERSIQQQKKLLVYFSEKGIPPKKFSEVNMDAIENFKSSHLENVYWWSCKDDEQLAELFKRQLQQTMNNLLENEIADYKSKLDALSRENKAPLSADNNFNTPALPALSDFNQLMLPAPIKTEGLTQTDFRLWQEISQSKDQAITIKEQSQYAKAVKALRNSPSLVVSDQFRELSDSDDFVIIDGRRLEYTPVVVDQSLTRLCDAGVLQRGERQRGTRVYPLLVPYNNFSNSGFGNR